MRVSIRGCVVFGVICAAFASEPSAFAQTAPPESTGQTSTPTSGTTQQALAQSFFDQAKKLMADGHYPEACAKFADSNRLAPGTGTLLNLANCHVKVGKLATAWVELNNAADGDRREGNAQRLAWIQSQIAALDPQLDYLTVNVPATTPTDLVVQLDGVKIDPAAFGAPTPLDPGDHVVQATATGYQAWSKKITMGTSADKQSADVQLIAAGVAPPIVVPVTNPPAQVDTPHDDRKSVDTTKRTVAYVLGGVAVVGLGVGTVFGVKTFSDWSDRNDNCPGGRCNQTAVDDYSSAKTAAIVSNISFGVAVVAAAAGTYFYLTSTTSKTSVAVGGVPLVGGGAAAISGHF